MTTYLALFRGINIGGHNKLPMQGLVSLLEELGCRNIRTYIQSGNVIFDSGRQNRSRLSSDIGHSIFKRYGFSPRVVLLSASELQEAIAHNPFPTSSGKALSLLFLEGWPQNPDLARLETLKGSSEQFMLIDKVFYLYAPDGVARSKLAAHAERCLGVAATGRNWNTVMRLSAMLNLDPR